MSSPCNGHVSPLTIAIFAISLKNRAAMEKKRQLDLRSLQPFEKIPELELYPRDTL